MKLRFRANSLRLRVNQNEVQTLSLGGMLKQQIDFPGNTSLAYTVRPVAASEAQVFYSEGNIQVCVPKAMLTFWASADDIGLYFDLPTAMEPLKIAIEKDMACLDGPLEESDPAAYPRTLFEKAC